MSVRTAVRGWVRAAGVAAGVGLAGPAFGQTADVINEVGGLLDQLRGQQPVARPVGRVIPPADSPPGLVPDPVVGRVTPVAPAPAGEAALAGALAEAKAAYSKIRDYAGMYVRQERVPGRLVPEEVCELRVRCRPFAASVKVVAPRELAGRETVISTGRAASKVKLKEPGRPAFVSLPADDPRAVADTRHALPDVGLLAVLDRVERAVLVERRAGNPVQVLAADYLYAGKPCKRVEVFCDRPHTHRYAARHVLFLDAETHLPVRYEAYDQPRPGEGTGDAIEVQSFVGLRFNVGLGESAFDR